MKDAILIQHVYPGYGMEPMLEMLIPHHQDYCDTHGIEYLPSFEQVTDRPVEVGAWAKVELIRQSLDKGYQYVVWLDADTMIIDTQTDLRLAVQGRKIGACWHRIPQMSHWNVGALYADNCQETRDFIQTWWNSYPTPRDGWLEQGAFNRLARESKTVVTLSDRWNATLDVNMVPDTVVLGFHGQGDTKQRIKLMQDAYERLFQKEKVYA